MPLVGQHDLDGDGRDDLLVRSWLHDGVNGVDCGAVYGVFGPIEGSVELEDAGFVRLGLMPYENFGYTAGAGDFDGDGVDDLVAGSPAVPDAEQQPRSGFLVEFGPITGEGLSSEMDLQIYASMSIEEQLHCATLTAEDGIGLDGRDELVLGCPADDTAAEDAGAVYLFLGETLAAAAGR